MKLIIDIEDEIYEVLKRQHIIISGARGGKSLMNKMYVAISKGIPLVHCRDCKWWSKEKDSLQGYCHLGKGYPTGAWFCGNGLKESGQK